MTRCRENQTCLHAIYLVVGPAGTYVGNTTRQEMRWKEHLARSRCSSSRDDLVVHRMMRRDGADLYSFGVIASARGCWDAADAELSVIRQLRVEGVHVLNVLPMPRRGMRSLDRARMKAERLAS